jgi:protease I
LEEPSPLMESPLVGKRVAVLAENMYEDLELWYPLIRLREAGAEVSVVAPTSGATYKSKHGLEVKADLSAEDAKARQFDAVVIPGGFAPDYMRRSEAMVRFVKDANDEGKVVAAICHRVDAGLRQGAEGKERHVLQVDKGRRDQCGRELR